MSQSREREFGSEDIQASVAHISDVYRYAKGERVLPLQDKALESEYTSALDSYFHLTRSALTDPDIVAMMKRGKIGQWGGDDTSYVVRHIKGSHDVAKYINQRSGIVCLMTHTEPELVYSNEKLVSLRSSMTGEKIDIDEEVEKWQDKVPQSDVVSKDWAVGHGFDRYNDYLHLFAYRTMQGGDLLEKDMLPRFVGGIRHTFNALRRSADVESAVKFNDIADVARIKSITQAFNSANNILQGVLTPDSFPKPGTPRNRRIT